MIRITTAFLLLFASIGVSAGRIYGSWSVDNYNDYFFAVTDSSSGAILGQFCYTSTGSCVWIIGTSMPCEAGIAYQALANSDAGSAQVSMSCGGKSGGKDGLYNYAFTNFSLIDELVRKSRRIGFATTLDNGQFQISRFDLTGSSAALDAMREAANRRSQGGKDEVL